MQQTNPDNVENNIGKEDLNRSTYDLSNLEKKFRENRDRFVSLIQQLLDYIITLHRAVTIHSRGRPFN